MSATQQLGWASDVQRQVFEYGPYPVCASGGWGASKTWAFCLKALWLSDTFPKNRGVIARQVGKELRATTMQTFYKLCPPSAYQFGRRNDQDGSLVLNNGSEILWVHLDNPETQGLVRGLEINWFFIDQAEENPEEMEEIFDLFRGRLGRWDQAEVPQWLLDQEAAAGRQWKFISPQTGKPQPPPYAMLAVNPDSEVHWVYRRFHPDSVEHQQTYRAKGYKMFHMPSLDNRFLADTNREALLDHDDAFIRRYVLGIWGMPEGAIHTIDKLSLIDGSEDVIEWLRRTCTLHRVMDHGDSAPTCCLWYAVDPIGNVFFYREYYAPNQLISTHRARISELSEGEVYGSNLADPSIFNKISQKHGGRWSVADEYSDVREHPRDTAIFWTPADNNELGTRNRINEGLKVHRSLLHPITKAEGSPRIFFVTASAEHPQGCQHVLREMKAQRRVKIGTDNGRPIFSDDRDPDVVDHAYDPVRYAIASRPAWARIVQNPGPGSFFAARQRLAKQQSRLAAVR